MNTQFDRHKFQERQLVCHFRNDYELTRLVVLLDNIQLNRKDYLIKNYKKAKKLADRSGVDTNKAHNFLPSSYVLPVCKHINLISVFS